MVARCRDPASILVYVGLDAVGDGLMKLPFARALRGAFPDARITWMAGKGHTVYAGTLAPLVAGLIDEVLDEAGVGSRAAELFGPRPLAGRSFDLIIDTQRRVLTTLILRRIRHRCFLSAAASHLLSDRRPARRGKPAALAAQMRALIDLAGGTGTGAEAPLPTDPALAALAARLLPDGPTYVGLAPGAGGVEKRWPLDRYLALAADLATRGLVPVVLLGPAETEWAAVVRDTVPAARLPLQDTAETSPLLTIALARRLAAAVANDSGTGHMLAAADLPLVSLFGPTPPEKFAPAAGRLIVLKASDWGGPEMARIPEDAVAAALERLLAGGLDRPTAAIG
jgi:ADP-heptose:LPS heptosyltransferase